MKPTFDFTTLLVRPDSIPDYREAAEPAAREYHCIAAPGPELYPYAEIDSSVTEPREMALRITACVNACHGLDLPPDIVPGALAALVTAACRVLAYYDEAGRTREPGGAYEGLAAALAPFTPDPAPVSPPVKGYAFKTPAGYLAHQGRAHWYEAEPVGWALFTEADHAAKLGASMGLTGEAVPVY